MWDRAGRSGEMIFCLPSFSERRRRSRGSTHTAKIFSRNNLKIFCLPSILVRRRWVHTHTNTHMKQWKVIFLHDMQRKWDKNSISTSPFHVYFLQIEGSKSAESSKLESVGGFWSNFSNGTQDTVHKDTVGHKAFEVMYMEWDTRLETAFFRDLNLKRINRK